MVLPVLESIRELSRMVSGSVLVGVMLMFWGHAGLEQARFCPMKPHLWLTHTCMEPVVLQGGASALPGDSCCGRAVLGEDRDRVSFLCRA